MTTTDTGADAGTPVRIVAEAQVAPGRMPDLLPLLGPLTIGSRGETGNVSYAVHVDTHDSNHLLFVEEWATREAFDAHLTTPHLLTYATNSAPLLDGPPRIIIATALTTAPQAQS